MFFQLENSVVCCRFWFFEYFAFDYSVYNAYSFNIFNSFYPSEYFDCNINVWIFFHDILIHIPITFHWYIIFIYIFVIKLSFCLNKYMKLEPQPIFQMFYSLETVLLLCEIKYMIWFTNRFGCVIYTNISVEYIVMFSIVLLSSLITMEIVI